MKKKFLVLVSTNFPYGLREPFLESELKQLALHYHKVLLLVPNLGLHSKLNPHFDIPDNVMIIQFTQHTKFLEKLLILKYTISPAFWIELITIKRNYKINPSFKILKTLLSTMIKANSFANQVKNLVSSMNIPLKRTTFYTYWLTEYSLGIGLLNKRYKIAGAYSRVHNWDLYFERAESEYLPMRKQILSLLNAVFSVSEQGKNYLLKKLPTIDAEKILVSRLGVDNITNEVSLKKAGKLKILSLAFLGKIKRIDLLVNALEKIEDIEIEWHHIGMGNDHLDINQYAFNRLFNKSNVTYNITGDLSKRQVYEQLQKEHYNVLINTSQYEGIPVSMMEAMSFSIPVIGTNVGGVSEIIENGFNGFLMSANPNIDEIISYLKKFNDLTELEYNDFCNNAKKTWATKFNAELNYSELAYSMVQLSKSYN